MNATQGEVYNALKKSDGVGRADVEQRCKDLVNARGMDDLPPRLKALVNPNKPDKIYSIEYPDGTVVNSKHGLPPDQIEEIRKLPKRTYFRVDPSNPLLTMKVQEAWRQHALCIGSFEVMGFKPVAPKAPVLVIVGSGRGYDSDLRKVEKMGLLMEVMTVNSTGPHVPSRFWYSIHGEWLTTWEEYVKSGKHLICEWYTQGIDSCYGFYNRELARIPHCGFSGNFAMLTGLVMGYHRVILCGCPLDNRPISRDLEVYDGLPLDIDTWSKHNDIMRIQLAFQFMVKKFPEVRDRVRSMSGHTKKILGEPTMDWLTGKDKEKAYQASYARIEKELGCAINPAATT